MAAIINKYETEFAANDSRVCVSVRVYGGENTGRYRVFIGNGKGTALLIFTFNNEVYPLTANNLVYDALQHAYVNINSALELGNFEARNKLAYALMALVESWQTEPLYSESWYENPCESRDWACSM